MGEASGDHFMLGWAGAPTPPTTAARARTRRVHDATRAGVHTIERLTVAEAAQRLGISKDAVRARIKRDTIAHERDEIGNVFVFIDTAPTNGDQGGATDADQGDQDADHTDQGGASTVEAELRDRLRFVEERLTFMEEQLGLERDANRENRRLLAAALERIPAIEAAPEATEAPESGEGAPYGTSRQEAEDSLHPRRERSWWRRFFGFE